jgi:hypothetical protein
VNKVTKEICRGRKDASLYYRTVHQCVRGREEKLANKLKGEQRDRKKTKKIWCLRKYKIYCRVEVFNKVKTT